jgi:hypothetical protein
MLLAHGFSEDLWGFLNQRKKLWLLPAILVLLVFGTVIVLTGGTAIAPVHLHAVLMHENGDSRHLRLLPR